MLLTKLKLNYFGRFHDREINLKPGINLIYGENEAGKSTLHTFIKGMLFGIERLRGRGAASKDDLYTRYLPWDYPGAYGGQMDILVNDRKYRLQRSFHANDKSFMVTDLETGRQLKLKEGHISELIPGLSESTFRNTISIEQLKAQTDLELASQVRNYITNLSIAKSKEVNVAKAVSTLTEQKKALEAAMDSSVLLRLKDEIEEGMDREEQIDALTIELRSLTEKDAGLKEQLKVLNQSLNKEEEERMGQLPAILEKYTSYQEYQRQSLSLEHQIGDLKAKLTVWEKECKSCVALKDDLEKAQQLNREIPEHGKKQLELQREQSEAIRKGTKKNVTLAAIPVILAIILSLLLSKSASTWLIAIGGSLIVSGILLPFLNKGNKQRTLEYEVRLKDLREKETVAGNRVYEILHRYDASSIEELSYKQNELLKLAVTLEHGKKQLDILMDQKSDLEDKKDRLHDTIMKYIQHFTVEEELKEEAVKSLQEIIRRKRAEHQEQQTEIKNRIEECRLQTEKIRWELSSMEGNEEQLLKNKDLYSALEQKQKDNKVELDAVRLALGTIQELSATIHDSFGRQLNQAVSAVISRVTDRRYEDLKVDEKLNIKIGWNGEYILLDRLSAGTIDQVYFALRLAVADLLLGEEEMPLVLDDSFALYDDNRVKSALSQIAGRKQILLFSCHNREKKLLEELKLPYEYILL